MTKEVTVNGLVHFDVAGPDAEALHGFYHRVFGWRVDVQGPGYALVATPDGSPDGAIVEDERAALTVGVAVRDLDATVEAAVAAGGTVVMAPVDNGWVVKARVADPAGNELTLVAA
jgi:predicted enzyme related to lactoylglutathione lyase